MSLVPANHYVLAGLVAAQLHDPPGLRVGVGGPDPEIGSHRCYGTALREVTRRILTRNGYHVLTAASGPDALKTAEHTDHGIELLLTDVIMPHMLGKELATKIRETCPAVKVLYMSGYAQPVLASQGTLDPGVTLVEKPFTESRLLQRIRDVLDAR